MSVVTVSFKNKLAFLDVEMALLGLAHFAELCGVVIMDNLALAITHFPGKLKSLFFFFKQKTAYEMIWCLEFRRVLFRSHRPDGNEPRGDGADPGPRAACRLGRVSLAHRGRCGCTPVPPPDERRVCQMGCAARTGQVDRSCRLCAELPLHCRAGDSGIKPYRETMR